MLREIYLAYSLCGTGGRRDDVEAGTPACAEPRNFEFSRKFQALELQASIDGALVM